MPTPTLPEQASEQAGYKTVNARYKGSDYQMTLYEGFVGSSSVLPNGVDRVELYRQQGVYHVPQTPGQPQRGPDARSNVKLVGGPNRRNVHLRIVNEPQDPATYKGPILSFTVTLRDPVPSPPPVINRPDLVQVVVGDSEIESIFVRTSETDTRDLTGPEAAGTSGAGSGTGAPETWVVEDSPQTCPADCP